MVFTCGVSVIIKKCSVSRCHNMNEHDELGTPPAHGPSTAHSLMGVERIGAAGGGGAAAVNGTEPPRKRCKLAGEEAGALRRRILECELQRLRALRDRFTERLYELYFLQAGGNMMDYAAWRKRPPAPQLLAFLEARRPPPVTAPPPAPAPAPVPAAAPTPAPAPAPADEMVEKAKREAYVASRVAELARAGLWAERRLPRVLEPPRAKSHWDYVLEEMAWLSQDFAHERKWKKQAAKKCARAVHKHFQERALAVQRAEKAQELHLRKIAAFAAREIRTFWANVEKLVEWKRVRRVERARKEALDEQLSYIVDKTERYSRALAAGLAAPAPASGAAPAPDTPPSDEEFTPRGDDQDDEETIAAAEREAGLGAADHRAELDALRRDSRRALGDLLPPGYTPAGASSAPAHGLAPALADYGPDEDSADDESTIAEQERAERGRDHAAELAALHADADLDLDELRRRYAAPPPDTASPSPTPTPSESESGESSDVESTASSSSSASSALEALVEGAGAGGAAGAEGAEGAEGEESGSRRVEEAATLAAALQPTGTTLSSTAVGTPVPALLRHALREYQHVGLHWLATMYARGLNGILADEMGLGKTVQTIALLAHLALERRDWGPHLVVAPTSVVLNWEMEFKKWCPAFKILTYMGTIKERKLKRVGWTKNNSFHVCITSYKLVVQDHQSFRRKRWKYLVLDEAQNIKNFKSQRWQLLLNFQTERRLLLTGTPLQNSLLELWSLMHFLMPDVFASHSEFRAWFGSVTDMAEGSQRYNEALVRRLHAVLRPFLLRRLKADVERQMPRKYEHVLLCRLARRQRFLYDDFMARAKTKESLASGNLLSVINVLMQLRKVCNHPDLFEQRPVSSPLQLAALRVRAPALVLRAAVPERVELAARLGGDLAALEAAAPGAFAAHRARHLAPPRRLVEELAESRRAPAPAPRPPRSELRLHLRLVPRAPPPAGAAPPTAAAARAAPSPRAAAAPPPAPPAAAPLARLEARRRACLRRLAAVNERRCWRLPLYGADLRAAVCARVPAPAPPARDLPRLLRDMHDVIDRFTVCWRGAVAPAPELCVGGGARAWRARADAARAALEPAARATLAALHAPAVRQAVAFPHPSLLQYDCGKLQTLCALLRRLKAGGHRVLIFTQMTRVLDVLEAFLSMHGHAYLRLDGGTRPERRQALVERFNADARVFAFVLSTRSGGVGLNLTGADAVVFYDSDWNPTMDAQAQDRAHRIGQTRDVHVYRLVTKHTVEENILRKAEQKRALGHLAIDHGHFTTSYLRGASIEELFGPAGAGAGAGVEAVGGGESLERALAAAEDEADAAAAAAARTETCADLAEFDESVPLDEHPPAAEDTRHAHHDEKDELAALMLQLTPVEKYAMRVVESSEAGSAAERAALGEMRRQRTEWEAARRELRAAPQPAPDPQPETEPEPEPEPELTYARTEEWVADNADDGYVSMPAWCPPTPPQGSGDVYCESWARALYRAGAAADALLPAAARRDRGPPRPVRPARLAARPHHAPLSLFERSGARRGVRARLPPPPSPHPAPQPDWTGGEDAALRRALRLQRLPLEPPAALAPNWEWVADLVADQARAFRSPRACRDRHDALADPERARRRHRRPAAPRRRAETERDRDRDRDRPSLHRLEAVRDAAERRRRAPRRRPDDAPPGNPKHAALLADHGVDYDAPPTPMEVATRRAERIAREKLKAHAPAPGPAPAPAPAAPAAPAPAPAPRVLVASADAARRPPPRPPPAAAPAPAPAPAPAQLLYRQQPFPARHLKILHQAPAPHAHQQSDRGGGDASPGAGASSPAPAALRKLQLQQLALRRAASPASPAAPPSSAPHVVVAHLAPRAPPADHPPAPAPAPRHRTDL